MLRPLLDVVATLERFLERRRESAATRSANHRLAIESAMTALLETERYLFDRGEGSGRDSGREGELARLWGTAISTRVGAGIRALKLVKMASNFGTTNIITKATIATANRHTASG